MAVYALGDQVPDIHETAYVHPQATVIGSVTLGAGASVWPQAVIRADDGPITVGENTSIQDGAVIHTTAFTPTKIGANVTVGHLAHLEDASCTIGHSSVLVRSCCTTPSFTSMRSLAVPMVPGGVEVPRCSMASASPPRSARVCSTSSMPA